MSHHRPHLHNTLRAFIREAAILPGIPIDPIVLFTDASKNPFVKWPSLSSPGGVDTDDEGEIETAQGSSTAAPSDATLDALIIGDSQAGGALGAALQRRLENMGYNVTRTHDDGAPGSRVLKQLPDFTGGVPAPDLVVGIFGGNDSSPASAVSAAQEMYQRTQPAGSFLLLVGPPPATLITDTQSAGEVFAGTLGPDPAPEAWLELRGGGYAQDRREIAEGMEAALNGQPQVAVYGIAAHWGPAGGPGGPQNYPDQPDGLHLAVGADAVAEAIINGTNMMSVTDLLRSKLKTLTPPPAPVTPIDPGETGAGETSDDISDPAYYADISIDVLSQKDREKFERLANSKKIVKYDSLIRDASEATGVPSKLIHAVIMKESAYNPDAVSPVGAAGIMQFMPGTGVMFGLTPEERFDPAKAIPAGAAYLSKLYNQFGNWPHALAGYNAGPGRVTNNRWWRIPETKDYVRKVMAYYHALGGVGYK